MSKTKQRKAAGRRYARVQARDSWRSDLPILPIVVGGLLLLSAIVLIVIASMNSKSGSTSGTAIDSIQCQSNEQLSVHYHAHLAIFVDGNQAVLPANVGVDNADSCLYWMHTHPADGVIHIEAPKSFATHKFTLGEFFDVWKKRLDSSHVGDTALSGSQKLVVFVDGKTVAGDPRKVVLGPHTQVTLEVTPPEVNPPPTFSFPSGE